MTTLMQLMGAEVVAKAGPMKASLLYARCCEAGFRMGVKRYAEAVDRVQVYNERHLMMQVLASAGLDDPEHRFEQALIRKENPNAPEIPPTGLFSGNRFQDGRPAALEISKPRPNWRIVAEERGADCERFKKQILDLKEELKTTEVLLDSRQELLDAIPECPEHGKCVPHALEWIRRAKARLAILDLEEK